jgi:hypothetical protein
VLLALMGSTACTEDPTLDKVGGSGAIPDAARECSQDAPDAATRFLPCDVEAVLKAKCQRCHNSRAVLDVCYPAKTCVKGPFPLLNWSDTHKPLGTTPIFELMQQAVSSGYMPFKTTDISPPVEPLTTAEKATLINWTQACAPGRPTACPAPGDAAARTLDGGASGDK